MFVNASARNYQLFTGSPAIDTGGAAWYPPGVDLLGVARPQGGAIEMGAYEWTATIPPVSTARFQVSPRRSARRPDGAVAC
jgi:hypothetical protein